ncbi:hypothetical protein HNQ56_000653 [Anaerotaenia torta]|uniref:zf-HC2 domain-containing protein n=1 Tax=Anaerotaenia torta TaxID=433293 RepID=UPI003D212205
MKMTCDVIKDLLPLYVENISSNDTRILIEEHIISCESCKKELEKLYTPKELPLDTNALPLRKLQRTLFKRKYLTIFFSALLTVLVLIIAMGYITAPKYIPYSENPITITEDNRSVIVHFKAPGARYRISKSRAEDNSGYVYSISLWDSVWIRSVYKDPFKDFILNPNGETVSGVYFSSNDGSEDILIYGKDPNPGGKRITLPRLLLSYYALLAALLAAIAGTAMFFFRNHQRIKSIVYKFFALPAAYLLGHLCIKGFSFLSYSASRDFFAILLAMLPIYYIMLIIEKITVRQKVKAKQNKA